MSKTSLLLIAFVFSDLFGENPVRAEVTHSFLACGQNTYMVDASGKKTWTCPLATSDGYANGHRLPLPLKRPAIHWRTQEYNIKHPAGGRQRKK